MKLENRVKLVHRGRRFDRDLSIFHFLLLLTNQGEPNASVQMIIGTDSVLHSDTPNLLSPKVVELVIPPISFSALISFCKEAGGV